MFLKKYITIVLFKDKVPANEQSQRKKKENRNGKEKKSGTDMLIMLQNTSVQHCQITPRYFSTTLWNDLFLLGAKGH